MQDSSVLIAVLFYLFCKLREGFGSLRDVLVDGKVQRPGGPDLALELEDKGYGWLEPGQDPGRDETPAASA